MISTVRPEYQIIPFPKWAVRCVCGHAHDSREDTEAAAIAEVRAMHDPACEHFTATAYPA